MSIAATTTTKATTTEATAPSSFSPSLGLDVAVSTCLQFATLPDTSFGIEVTGVRWDVHDPELVRLLTLALRRNLLLVLRGQPCPSEVQLDAFLRQFGRLVLETEDGAAHYLGHRNQGGPASQMAIESKQYMDRSADNTGSTLYAPGADGISELVWHNDQSHRPMRKVVSVFEALDVEPGVTPTEYRDLYTAYETLPTSLRTLLENRQVIYFDPRLPSPADMPRLADATHPVFTPHPHTGRRTIYVNDFADRIAGMNRDESDRVLAELRAHIDATAPRLVHQWSTGDLVLWDNIGLQHRRGAVPGGQRRHMRQHGGLAE